jgi:hypothetical protein
MQDVSDLEAEWGRTSSQRVALRIAEVLWPSGDIRDLAKCLGYYLRAEKLWQDWCRSYAGILDAEGKPIASESSLNVGELTLQELGRMDTLLGRIRRHHACRVKDAPGVTQVRDADGRLVPRGANIEMWNSFGTHAVHESMQPVEGAPTRLVVTVEKGSKE